MPIYEFKCSKCKRTTEKMLPITDDRDYIICNCDYIATKILSSGIFNIKGYSEGNGYSKGEN